MSPTPHQPGRRAFLLGLLGAVMAACGPGAARADRSVRGAPSPQPADSRRWTPTPAPSGHSPAVPVPDGEGHRDRAGAPPPPVGDRSRPSAPLVALLGSSARLAPPLGRPVALAVDRAGALYVADAADHHLAVVDRAGQSQAEWGSDGRDGGQFRFRALDPCADDAPGLCPPDRGGGVAVDGQGRVYVADYGNHRVQVFDGTGRLLAGWGGEGGGPGQFRLPRGIAVDGRGHVYVSDTGNHRIQQFAATGTFLGQWGSPGRGAGRLGLPGGLAVDDTGLVYVTDTLNRRVQTFDGAGRFLSEWGTAGLLAGGTEPVAGIAADQRGHVYVCTARDGIQQFDRAGRLLGAWGGDGQAPALPRRPVGVAVDEAGDVYVADRDDHRVLKFRSLLPVTLLPVTS